MIIEEPIRINKLIINNRIVMPPMATGKCGVEGSVSDELITYYEDRARGGYVGLLETEHTYITPQGIAAVNQVSTSKDEDIEGLSKIAKAVHAAGSSKIFCQLNHAGMSKAVGTPLEAVAPSAIQKPWKLNAGLPLPHALSTDEIKTIIEEFAAAAVRAKKAGFDGVELHCAHGNLLNQFYSPITNIRDDEYGGSLVNRLRATKEAITRVREAVGPDYPISVRFGAVDYYENGNELDACIASCGLIEEYGADLLSLTGGMKGYIRPGHSEPGYFKEMSIAAKKIVNIPVMLTGGVTTIQEAEDLLREGAADLIGVGRPMMKNASWAKDEFDRLK